MAPQDEQRASAGLIIAEATMGIAGHSAFWNEPGTYTQAQIEAWRLTTVACFDGGAWRQSAKRP
jgi:N-ethylmaleimide reductase